MISEWYTVPPGADGPEMRLELPGRHSGRVTLVRALCSGQRVLVHDRYRGRFVEASRPWRNLEDATEIAIGLALQLDDLEDARREIAARERDRARGYTRDQAGDRNEVQELRRRLDDPAYVVGALGLAEGARRQPRGLLVRCPTHDDRSPSCSVRVANDGTIAARCHACGWSGDVLGLVAAVRGLDSKREFRRVLEAAAEIAGVQLRRAG